MRRSSRAALAARLAVTAAAVLLCGCPGAGNNLPPAEGGPNVRTVAINGRVVDFETCLSAGGCKGAENLRVALFYDPTIVSDKTRPDGAFTLKNVPSGVRAYLLVSDASGSTQFLSTLQAAPITTEGKDVFGLELYALQRGGGLYDALVAEASLNVESRGIYIGQVVSLESGTMKAFQGATAGAVPYAPVRFVRDNPRFSPGEKALFDTNRSVTGVFGQFVIASDGAPRDYGVAADSKDYTFTPVLAPLGSGYVTIGVHRAERKTSGPLPVDSGGGTQDSTVDGGP
ncbi:MAG: hypothetical protein KC503_40960 [Myxococcales bacterium]|nr:hypothetical protein [Myxococcales bacterium]